MWRGSLGNRSAHQQITRLSPRCRSMQLREFAQSRKSMRFASPDVAATPQTSPRFPGCKGPRTR
jgi:hypothetical protein